MTELLQKLVDSPELPKYMQELIEIVARESALRRKFYDEITEDQKAEFINGQVIMHSPVQRAHSVVSDCLFTLLNAYVNTHKLGWVGHEKLMVSLIRNDYEPAIAYWKASRAASFTPEQMRFPAPDFVAEILSPSTEERDRGVKFEDYAANGVGEYWIMDPSQERIEKFVLSGRQFASAGVFTAGQIRSEVLAGFEIPVRAVFEPEANLAALRSVVGS